MGINRPFSGHCRAVEGDGDSGTSTPGVPTPTDSDSAAEDDETGLLDTPVPCMAWQACIFGVIASMGGFIVGYSTGQISGFLNMQNFKERFGEHNPTTNEYEFSNLRKGLIVSMLSVGTMIGSLAAAPIADRFGRTSPMRAWSTLCIFGIAIQLLLLVYSESRWYQVAIGRLVAGIPVGALSSMAPMYLSESAPRHIRGAMVGAFQLFIASGMFFSYVINFATQRTHSELSWSIPILIGDICPLVFGIGAALLHESPRYAYGHGQHESAKVTMAWLYGVPENHPIIHQEMLAIKTQHEDDISAPRTTWREIISAPGILNRTLVGMALQSLQQLTGASFIIHCGNTVFATTGLDPYRARILFGGVNLLMTLPSLYLVERFGRRKCLITGAAWMSISCFVWASVGHFGLNPPHTTTPPNTPNSVPGPVPGAGIALIALTCFFIAGSSTTWSPIIWTVCAELYPTRYRATGIGISTATSWMVNFLVCFFSPAISDAVGFCYGYVFSGACVVGSVVVFAFVVETKGRYLEEVDEMYEAGVRAWESRSWVSPPIGRVGVGVGGHSGSAGIQPVGRVRVRVQEQGRGRGRGREREVSLCRCRCRWLGFDYG